MRGKFNRLFAAVAACVLGLSASAAFAQTSSIPDVGVDMSTVLTDYGTALGAVVLVAVGIVFAFRLIRRAMRWVGGSGA